MSGLNIMIHDLAPILLKSYQSKYIHRRTPSARYMYHCAQVETRQQKSKKGTTEGKPRDKDHMDRFECDGWLHITVFDDSNIALVKYKHKEDHIHYWSIEVPLDVKEYVENNPDLNPTQVSIKL